jgi:branched-chain amino acid transport system ATP-binding protein
MSLLELRHVTAGYGQFTALWDVSLRVERGEAIAVVGPNGAGKTTLMRVISGLIRPRGGAVVFDGAALDGRPAHEVVARGIAHVPEGRRIFPRLSVADNLKMGAFLPAARRTVRDSLERVYTLFPVLSERQRQRAGSLSGGEQQMLALGRALMGRPRLLLLDEPSLGLAPMVVREFFRIVRELNEKEGLTVLVVEQDARIALRASQRAYVLEVGRVALTGTSGELEGDESIRRSYLGY